MNEADLALVLMADASASVSYEEFGLIAGGMAAALRDKAVIAGLVAGPRKASLVAVLLFSGASEQDLAMDWTRIASSDDALRVADRVEQLPRILKPGLTAIGNALEAAATLLGRLTTRVGREVIDVAGDGRANDGVAPAPVRDRLVAAGVTINGLCVLHEEPDLIETFRQEIIGGPGAFAQPCASFGNFAEAMRRKLVRESLIAEGCEAGVPDPA